MNSFRFLVDCCKSGSLKSVDSDSVRQLMDSALEACGLHVTEGWKVWNAAIKWEEEQEKPDVERLRRLYETMLGTAMPEKARVDAYEKYVEFRNVHGMGDVEKSVEKKYQRAVRAYEMREGFEEALKEAEEADTSGSVLLSAYMSYIDLEISSGDGDRVKIMYERALARFPVSDALWRSYISYLEAHEEDVDATVQTKYKRSIRCCPWVGELWCSYLRYLYRSVDSTLEGSSVDREYSKAVESTCFSAHDFRAVALVKGEILRQGGVKNLEAIRNHFQAALVKLAEIGGGEHDPEQKIMSAWTCCEGMLSDPEKVVENIRAAWAFLNGASNLPDSKFATSWIRYSSFLARFGGSLDLRRDILHQGISHCAGLYEQNMLAYKLLDLEKEEGTIDSLRKAAGLVYPYIQKAETSSWQAAASEKLMEIEKERLTEARRDQDPNFKRKRDPQHRDTQAPKRSKNEKKSKAVEQQQHGSQNLVVFVKHIVISATEESLLHFFTEKCGIGSDIDITIGRDPKTNRSKGYAYLRCDSVETRDALIALNGVEYEGKNLFIAISSPPKNKKEGFKRSGKQIEKIQDGKTTEGRTQRARLQTTTDPATLVPRSAALAKDSVPKTNDDFRSMFLPKK